MKKYILILYDISSFRITRDETKDDQNLIKIALADDESDEKGINVPVLTYRLESLDLVSRETLNEILKAENHQAIIIERADGPPTEKEIYIRQTDISEKYFNLPKFSLTPKQMKVMELLTAGLQYKEIASTLNLSFHTVKNHVSNVYDKMEVNCIGEAVQRYMWYKKLMN